MLYLYSLVLALICSIHLIGADKYDNPFVAQIQLEDLKGNRITYSEKHLVDDNNATNYKSIMYAYSDNDYFGSMNAFWFYDLIYEEGNFDSNSTYFGHVIDGELISYSEGVAGYGAATYFINKRPKNKYVRIGDEFPRIIRNHWSRKFEDSEYVTFITQETYATIEIIAIESINTPWGIKKAMRYQIDVNATLVCSDINTQSKETVASWYDKQPLYYQSGYFIKGLGLFKSENISFEIDWHSDSHLSKSVLNKRFPKIKVTTNFESTSLNLKIEDFEPINEVKEQSTILNTWTWNGAFPWVYNHETASWFYYHFAGNTCNAYDARNGNWFTFNGTSNSWVKSN
jgi:hypothetical protein